MVRRDRAHYAGLAAEVSTCDNRTSSSLRSTSYGRITMMAKTTSVFGPGDLDAGIEYQAHQALSIGLQSSSDVARKVHMSPFALRDE